MSPLSARLAPGLEISPCQSPLTQAFPGTDGAIEFLPFLNWTACSRHPELWPLQGGEEEGGYVTESSPSPAPRNNLPHPSSEQPRPQTAFAGLRAAAMPGSACWDAWLHLPAPGSRDSSDTQLVALGCSRCQGAADHILGSSKLPGVGRCQHILLQASLCIKHANRWQDESLLHQATEGELSP